MTSERLDFACPKCQSKENKHFTDGYKGQLIRCYNCDGLMLKTGDPEPAGDTLTFSIRQSSWESLK